MFGDFGNDSCFASRFVLRHCTCLTVRFMLLFTARRYVSAVYAMALCSSVCVRLSQVVGVLSKRLNEVSWFLAGLGTSFDLSCSVLEGNSVTFRNTGICSVSLL